MTRAAALPAKASVPRAATALPRARVFRILDRALARGAAWLAAPPGAGKDELPPVIEHRQKLRRRFIRLVLDFAGALEPQASERAIAVYERALAIDDEAAPLWQGLMRAHLAAGQPGDAVRAFESCRLALHAGGGPADELPRPRRARAQASGPPGRMIGGRP
jgi:hypothetical protein